MGWNSDCLLKSFLLYRKHHRRADNQMILNKLSIWIDYHCNKITYHHHPRNQNRQRSRHLYRLIIFRKSLLFTLLSKNMNENSTWIVQMTWTGHMSGTCKFDRAWNVELVLNVKCLVLSTFLTAAKFYNLGHIQG